MSIWLIVCIVGLVISAGVKLHRGSFFWWSGKKDTSATSDRSDLDDRR